MILIVSRATDVTAQDVHAELLHGRHPSRFLDFDYFPSRDCIRYARASDGRVARSYWLDGMPIDLRDVTSILWRRPAASRASGALADPDIRRYVEASSDEVLEGLFNDLDCLQVPARRDVLKNAYAKIPQLALAERMGFTLPATLVTNDPSEFLDFYRQHEGRVITKTASVHADSWIGPMGTGYARLVQPRDLIHFHDVQLCPLIAQVYVAKAVEVRVTVIGGDVFAAEIHSQATRRTCIDWRRYDRHTTPHDVHALPDDVASRCVALVQAMGLVYGAVDLILTPEGRYVFLEINPNGEYKWIEHLTGLPITKRMVRLLVEGA